MAHVSSIGTSQSCLPHWWRERNKPLEGAGRRHPTICRLGTRTMLSQAIEKQQMPEKLLTSSNRLNIVYKLPPLGRKFTLIKEISIRKNITCQEQSYLQGQLFPAFTKQPLLFMRHLFPPLPMTCPPAPRAKTPFPFLCLECMEGSTLLEFSFLNGRLRALLYLKYHSSC